MDRALVITLTLTCLVACSSGTAPTPEDGGGGEPDGAVKAGPHVDGGASSDDLSGPAATPDLATPIEGYGTVYAYQTAAVASTIAYASTSVGASFFYAGSTTSTASCTQSVIAECQVTACTGGGTGPGMTPPGASAGTVTVSGGPKTVTLTTSAFGPVSESSNTRYWDGGQALTVTATGDTVGAFSATLLIPEQILVTHPYLPGTGSVPISRSAGLTLDWSGGVHGQAVFVLAAGDATGATSALCRYPAAQAHAVLPASVLSMFPAGLASFSASTADQHDQRVGNWQVTVSSSFNAVYDTGRTVAGQLQLN
jgi:hypothetical protein